MRTIHKATLVLTSSQEIMLPGIREHGVNQRNLKFLSVQRQGLHLTLWYQCETEEPMNPRTILIVGTGHEVPPEAKAYIGTVVDANFVWHFFDGGWA